LRILFVKLSALGDVIQTLPALSYLKRELPCAEIDWIVEERNGELLIDHPFLERTYLFKKEYFKNPFKFFSFVKGLRTKYYDCIIDFQGLLKSAILTSFARGKFRFGFANYREGSVFFYNVLFKAYDSELHAVKRYLLLVKKVLSFLADGKELELTGQDFAIDHFPEIPLSEETPKGLIFSKPYVLFVPSARWETKLWPYQYWEELLNMLKDSKSFDIYFIGGKEDPSKSFAEAMSTRYEGVYSLVSKLGLKELVYVMRRALGVVTVDTGPMHLASLLNKPIIALFGPTSSARTGPWSNTFKVLTAKLPCSPCFKKKCREKTCMLSIKPQFVYKELLSLLNFR